MVMSDNRDPRLNPAPGDVLRIPGDCHGMSDYPRTRTVYRLTGSRVLHSRGRCELKTWRKWARNSEVVTKGISNAQMD